MKSNVKRVILLALCCYGYKKAENNKNKLEIDEYAAQLSVTFKVET